MARASVCRLAVWDGPGVAQLFKPRNGTRRQESETSRPVYPKFTDFERALPSAGLRILSFYGTQFHQVTYRSIQMSCEHVRIVRAVIEWRILRSLVQRGRR
jgi:hypothetical protein